MKRAGWTLLPAVIGLLAALLWQQGWWANPIVYARADVGSILAIVGVSISLVWGAVWVTWRLAWRRREEHLAELEHEQADLHRRFIRRLDHELKNRLTAIRAALINLPDESDNVIVGGMRIEVNRLAVLSADLRKLAELETRPIEQELIDVTQLLAELVELAHQRPEAACQQLTLTVPHVPWPLPPISGDRDLLFLALHNLIDNSFKFSCPGDAIEVRAFEDGPSVAVEVADTGPGIDPEDLPHVGEELFRGRTTQAIDGNGLGLALVQTIVERHHGTLKIRSRVGQGTVVALRFPVARQSHA